MDSMDLKGKNVLVAGCGISGVHAALLLQDIGANPILFDEKTQIDEAAVRGRAERELSAPIILGSVSREVMDSIALVIISPGIAIDAPFINQFRDAGLPIWGEIELAYQFAKGNLVAITGTNGKTTTTALTGKIMRDYYESVFVVGNIGNAYTKEALKMTDDTVTVAEISSFQLESIENFKPQVSAVLNITPDHLDRHYTMENYANTKFSISKNQSAGETCVLNYVDPYTREFGEKCECKVVWFSSDKALNSEMVNGYFADGDDIKKLENGTEKFILNMSETNLLGLHNMENIMAAIAMCEAYGVPMDSIVKSVKEFVAVEHRIEFVATKAGVDYYNDSKGTNTDAAIKAIQAMKKPTILIGGGSYKGSTYDDWIESFDGKVKLLVLIGQTKEKIAACAAMHNFNDYVFADTFEEAMEICVTKSEPGDAVLLSPACASWGMFPNYEVRGNMFKEFVNKLS